MDQYLVDQCDALDATIMSGDALVDPQNRELLREHLERWYRVLIENTATFPNGLVEDDENNIEVYSDLTNLAIAFRAVGNETMAQKLDAMGNKLVRQK